VKKEVAATAGPCNFWQHSIAQYIFYMEIGTTTRNLRTADLGEADRENAGTFRRMNTGPPWPQALLEVCLCSGAPTQLLIGGALALAGLHAGPDGKLTMQLLVYVAGLDTVLLVGLVLSLLVLGGESPRRVLLGVRPIPGEVLRGFGLLPWVFLLAVATAMVLMRWAPGLFAPNPFETLASTRTEFVLLALVTVLAGGVREEIQRAFILHRFEQRLGGALVGVLTFGVLFGLGHLLQGWSVVIITALLGMLWSVVYLARRSVVAPMVSHASFNLIEVISFGLVAYGASGA
jgi:membrane protease YdiL (CAAX protease family)